MIMHIIMYINMIIHTIVPITHMCVLMINMIVNIHYYCDRSLAGTSLAQGLACGPPRQAGPFRRFRKLRREWGSQVPGSGAMAASTSKRRGSPARRRPAVRVRARCPLRFATGCSAIRWRSWPFCWSCNLFGNSADCK